MLALTTDCRRGVEPACPIFQDRARPDCAPVARRPARAGHGSVRRAGGAGARRLSTLFGCVLASCLSTDALASDFDLDAILRKDGVQLVAVEFYSESCLPCKEAAPHWDDLRKRFGPMGFRLVAIKARSGDKAKCSALKWVPDYDICDDEADSLLDEFRVESFPTAFLWDWRGRLLVSHNGYVKEIERAATRYFDQAVRVRLDVRGRHRAEVERAVRAQLLRRGKLGVVVTGAERAALRQIARQSQNLTNQTGTGCRVGTALPPNAVLSVVQTGDVISLKLTDANSHCSVGSAEVNIRRGRGQARMTLEQAAQAAVDELLANLQVQTVRPQRRVQQAVDLSAQHGLLFLLGTPAGARYNIQGLGMGGTLDVSTPQVLRLPLRPDPYTVQFTLAGHHPYVARVALTAGRPHATIQHTFEPVITGGQAGGNGLLVARSTPEGAKIYVDGRDSGRTTPGNLNLPAGPHNVRLEKPMYVPSSARIVVPADSFVDHAVELRANFGEITINAGPDRPSIFLNGRFVGSGSYHSSRQPAGGYIVKVSAPYRHPLEKTVVVAAGQPVREDIELLPSSGMLELAVKAEVLPERSARPLILIDDRPQDVNVREARNDEEVVWRAVVRPVASGWRRVEVQVPGFEPIQRRIRMTDGGSVALDEILRARFGMLRLEAGPGDVALQVDGVPRVYSKAAFRLDAGPHRLKLSRDGFKTQELDVEVLAGRWIDRTVTLRPRTGRLVISTTPPDAELWLGDRSLGRSPVTVPDAPVGASRLRAEAVGYTPTFKDVRVVEGTTGIVTFPLMKLGAIVARCKAGNTLDQTTIMVAGRSRSGSEAVFESLPDGQHVVRCRTTFGAWDEANVTTRAGEMTTVTLHPVGYAARTLAYEQSLLWRTRIMISGGAVAGAGFLSAIIAAAMASSASDDAAQAYAEWKDSTDPAEINAKQAAINDRTEAWSARRRAAITLSVIGAIGAAGAAAAWLWEPERPARRTGGQIPPSWRLRVATTPAIVGTAPWLGVEGSF